MDGANERGAKRRMREGVGLDELSLTRACGATSPAKAGEAIQNNRLSAYFQVN
jgi:hypothetical protein